MIRSPAMRNVPDHPARRRPVPRRRVAPRRNSADKQYCTRRGCPPSPSNLRRVVLDQSRSGQKACITFRTCIAKMHHCGRPAIPPRSGLLVRRGLVHSFLFAPRYGRVARLSPLRPGLYYCGRPPSANKTRPRGPCSPGLVQLPRQVAVLRPAHRHDTAPAPGPRRRFFRASGLPTEVRLVTRFHRVRGIIIIPALHGSCSHVAGVNSRSGPFCCPDISSWGHVGRLFVPWIPPAGGLWNSCRITTPNPRPPVMVGTCTFSTFNSTCPAWRRRPPI